MARYLLFTLIFSTFLASSQNLEEDKIYFSDALTLYLKDYNKKADAAIKNNEMELAHEYFDTLVKNHLQGTYLDKLSFNGYNTSLRDTDEFERPVILLTYESWCIPSEGEIPVLNKLAREYGDLMDFVVLFWDNKKTVRQKSRIFDKNITVIYVDEKVNEHMQTVSLLKHAMGLNLSFVISASHEILDINRRPPNYFNISYEDALAQNVTFITEQVAAIYLDLNINPNELPESLATF